MPQQALLQSCALFMQAVLEDDAPKVLSLLDLITDLFESLQLGGQKNISLMSFPTIVGAQKSSHPHALTQLLENALVYSFLEHKNQTFMALLTHEHPERFFFTQHAQWHSFVESALVNAQVLPLHAKRAQLIEHIFQQAQKIHIWGPFTLLDLPLCIQGAKSFFSGTPLQYAFEHQHSALVDLLLSIGANPYAAVSPKFLHLLYHHPSIARFPHAFFQWLAQTNITQLDYQLQQNAPFIIPKPPALQKKFSFAPSLLEQFLEIQSPQNFHHPAWMRSLQKGYSASLECALLHQHHPQHLRWVRKTYALPYSEGIEQLCNDPKFWEPLDVLHPTSNGFNSVLQEVHQEQHTNPQTSSGTPQESLNPQQKTSKKAFADPFSELSQLTPYTYFCVPQRTLPWRWQVHLAHVKAHNPTVFTYSPQGLQIGFLGQQPPTLFDPLASNALSTLHFTQLDNASEAPTEQHTPIESIDSMQSADSTLVVQNPEPTLFDDGIYKVPPLPLSDRSALPFTFHLSAQKNKHYEQLHATSYWHLLQPLPALHKKPFFTSASAIAFTDLYASQTPCATLFLALLAQDLSHQTHFVQQVAKESLKKNTPAPTPQLTDAYSSSLKLRSASLLPSKTPDPLHLLFSYLQLSSSHLNTQEDTLPVRLLKVFALLFFSPHKDGLQFILSAQNQQVFSHYLQHAMQKVTHPHSFAFLFLKHQPFECLQKPIQAALLPYLLSFTQSTLEQGALDAVLLLAQRISTSAKSLFMPSFKKPPFELQWIAKSAPHLWEQAQLPSLQDLALCEDLAEYAQCFNALSAQCQRAQTEPPCFSYAAHPLLEPSFVHPDLLRHTINLAPSYFSTPGLLSTPEFFPHLLTFIAPPLSQDLKKTADPTKALIYYHRLERLALWMQQIKDLQDSLHPLSNPLDLCVPFPATLHALLLEHFATHQEAFKEKIPLLQMFEQLFTLCEYHTLQLQIVQSQMSKGSTGSAPCTQAHKKTKRL